MEITEKGVLLGFEEAERIKRIATTGIHRWKLRYEYKRRLKERIGEDFFGAEDFDRCQAKRLLAIDTAESFVSLVDDHNF
jgi:hypothetical protein